MAATGKSPSDNNMSQREKLAGLADAATQVGTNAIPPIPKIPLPEDVVKRFPQLHIWLENWHRELERWRQQTDRAIRGPQT